MNTNTKKRMKLSLVFLAIMLFITLLIPNSFAADNSIIITMLGTSDIHGRFMPWDYASDSENLKGSSAQISTIIKEVRIENPNTILVDIGDVIQDNSAELFIKEKEHPAPLIMNKMGYDVWTVGNHEFDFGIPALDKIVGQFNGTVLGGNLYKDNAEQYYPGHIIIEKSGVKIGIIGLTTPMVAEFKEETDIFDGFHFEGTIESAKKEIKALEGKVDAIVGVIHMGLDNENNVAETGVRDIINACPEFDAVFAGHMHTLVDGELVGTKTIVTEPDKYGTHVSRIDLTFEKKDNSYELKKTDASVIVTADYEPDSEIVELLKPYHKKAVDDANMMIGTLTNMDMVPEKANKHIPVTQVQQTPLADFFAEVMMFYSDGADVVAFQIDTDNAKLDMGNITKKDMAYNYQYAGGEVTNFEITGKDLQDYLEWSASYFNQAKEGDVTISFDKDRRNSKYVTFDTAYGVSYDIDISKPIGKRVVNLKWLDGKDVTKTEKIVIGMNDYRVQQLIGDGGPLEGVEFKKLRSTQDETAFGVDEGTIRRLAARYIADENKGKYKATLSNTWNIIGVEKTPEHILELINEDIIEIAAAESGKSNVVSVNVLSKPTSAELGKYAEILDVDQSVLSKAKNNGELYKLIYDIKNADIKPLPSKVAEGTRELLLAE